MCLYVTWHTWWLPRAIDIMKVFSFHFEGRVADGTVENIQRAKSGNLSVSFPFLEDNTPSRKEAMDLNCHPITGSNVRLIIFDVFHQGNTKRTVESLRRIGCV